MSYSYLKFELPLFSEPPVEKSGSTKRNKIFSFILNLLQKSNPDFEKVYELVYTWLIEFDNNLEPIREIGLDKNEKVIVIGPYENNRGFWTDSPLKYEDIENCFDKIKPTTLEDFESNWTKYLNN